MEQENFINLSPKELDQFIYRIIPIDRYFELFNNQENALMDPRKWRDPFENFILNSRIETPSGETGRFQFRDGFRGQCCTLHKASDAIWRIYSPNSNAIRFRTTIRKLGQSLWETLGDWAHLQCFVGRVEYMGSRQMKGYMKNIFSPPNTLNSKLFAKTFLIKRRAFSHEREIRLMYFEKDHLKTEKMFFYPIQPNKLIDQVMFDPRMSIDETNSLKSRIRAETKYTGKMMRSLLYTSPKNFVIPFKL